MGLTLTLLAGLCVGLAGTPQQKAGSGQEADTPREAEVPPEEAKVPPEEVEVPSEKAKVPPKELYRKTLPSTGWIVVISDDGVGSGTGWVVDRKEKLLVTNHHVVIDPDHQVAADDMLRIFFPWQEAGRLVTERNDYLENAEAVRGEVFDADSRRDLAVIRVKSLPDDAAEIPLASASSTPGETVYSIGNPGQSSALWVFTSGAVRQVYLLKARAPWGRQEFRAVMTQSPTNPGDSGGPVVNDRGRLVAVTESYRIGARLISNCIDVSEVRDYLDEVRPFLHPKSAKDYNVRGVRYYDNDRYDRALCDFTAAIRRNKQTAKSYSNRGWTFHAKGDYESALADFHEAIRLDPEDTTFYRGRGLVYCKKGEYAQAIADLTMAIRLDPNEARCYDDRADIYYEKDDYDRAIADCSEAIRLDPEVATYWNNRGRAYRGKGLNDRAIADYTRAILLKPDGAVYYGNRAYAHYKNGDYRLADADYARMEQLNPKYAQQQKKPYARKYLRIANNSGETIRVYLVYHTKTTDQRWKWFPGPAGGSQHVRYTFSPGETAYVWHDEFKINADRIRIWAESLSGSGGWPTFREQDFRLVPDEGYKAYYMDTYTFDFLP